MRYSLALPFAAQAIPSFIRTGLFFGLFVLLPALLAAQTMVEDCNNGIDDDGDGLVDCYDPDCTCTGQCDSFYYTACNADCFYIPPCGQISLGVQWVSQASTGTYSPLVAGDMDRDGVPEVVSYEVESPNIYIIDGATGATKVHITAPTVFEGGTAPAIADLDNDGYGELVIVGNDLLLRCYEHNGALKYVSNVPVGYGSRYRFSVPNIADFDHDGLPEVNIGNQVFNGQTGVLLAQGGPLIAAGEHPARVANSFSFSSVVAMDVLPDNFCPDCAGLEIVAGSQVLSVNLQTGTVKLEVEAPAPFSDGYTSVADFDRDGDLDAVVQGQKAGVNTVYCWDLQTPTILREFQLFTNWQEGASRVNIADLDGNGELEITFVSYPHFYALRNDFSVLWSLVVNDVSAVTCSSVFDFCGDGSVDVIYRGPKFLQILEGATGQVLFQDDCLSLTHIETPLVLDVDADGQTEILIQCGSNGTDLQGNIVAYEAVGLPGIASRRVWNQHAYFNTNIEDDLTVPRYQQNPHIVGDSLRLNGFLNQYFNPTFPSPDGALAIQSVLCAGDSLALSFSVCNTGDNVLPPQTPVSLYRGNPQTAPALWLGSRPLGFALPADSCRNFTVKIPRVANDSLFVVLNDDHSEPTPYSLTADFPVTAIGECGFVNNIAGFYFAYQPAPVNLGPDTTICDNGQIPLTAAGNHLVAWQWQNGSSAPTFTALTPGLYAVTATDICGITRTDTRLIALDTATVAHLGPDRAICRGESIALSEQGFDTYIWTPAAAVNCATCASVTAAPAASGNIVLEGRLNNGCWSRDTLYLTVNDTFYHVVDTVVCKGKTITYNNQQFLPGEQFTFPFATIAGCDSTVLLRVMPLDTFSTAQSITLCAGQSVSIFGDMQNTSGIYRRTFAAVNGCDSTHTVQLTVLNPIQIALTSTPTCPNEQNGELTAAVTGDFPPFTYAWNPPAASSSTLTDLPAGAYQLTVTDNRNCTQTAQAQVAAYPPIVFSVETDSVRCYGEATGAVYVESADTSLVYSLDGNTYAQQTAFENLTAYAYTVYAQDVYGCVESALAAVHQPPQLIVALPADAEIKLGETVQLQGQVSGFEPITLQWSDTTYLSCDACPDPELRPLDSRTYVLRATDRNGCTAFDQWAVQVLRIIDLYVPNALAPEGRDGRNAQFQPFTGVAVARVTAFQVFDRWGSLMHEVRNVPANAEALTWDGRYRGKLVSPGVYGWYLEIELVDGVRERHRGDVTVVR